MIDFNEIGPPIRQLPMLDSRIRMRLLTDEHADHKLTLNLYLTGVGASDARVWCGTCKRTLRPQGRIPRPGEEVAIGIG